MEGIGGDGNCVRAAAGSVVAGARDHGLDVLEMRFECGVGMENASHVGISSKVALVEGFEKMRSSKAMDGVLGSGIEGRC